MRSEAIKSNTTGRIYDRYFISASNLTAHVAYTATLLSPYPIPNNLEIVCTKFYKAITESGFDEIAPEFYAIDENILVNKIKDILLNIPEFVAWNTPKNVKSDDKQREMFMFTSAYSKKPHPDDDFIDLDAFFIDFMNTFHKTERD